MKIRVIWINFHDVITNTLREIEFSFKNHYFRLKFIINKYRWYIEC